MTTVLVVEDDDAIRNNITRLLKLEGYAILAATDGALGLERAREARLDIVISDVRMPGMDGFALLEAMRADPPLAATPVMLLAAPDRRRASSRHPCSCRASSTRTSCASGPWLQGRPGVHRHGVLRRRRPAQ